MTASFRLTGTPTDPQRRFVEAVDGGDEETIGALMSTDLVLEDWMTPGETVVGLEQVGAFNAKILEAFPDVRFPVDEALVFGDDVLLVGHFEATFTGESYLGFAAHGRPVRWEFRDLYRFDDRGQLALIRLANDTLVVARELGAELPAGLWG